ncbi:hypothetical protein GIB67_031345 [Kingdonia uniflora]|uniref:Bifunctional inhibitor/plant lipid transfer protein/seed storage helical domain-containing protein n=1 Tax=Kingdonia uniflora TaxID=39325 RepID=A0A7J7MH43_9MAGN|nr:hypothetical protein GIB67_031345 [Kingdonia uniflora]
MSNIIVSIVVPILVLYTSLHVNSVVARGHHHNATSPSSSSTGGDCETLVLDMTSCVLFVSNDSTTSKPDVDCCNGLKTVIKTNTECVCESFSTASGLGIVVNLEKAAALPSACGVTLPLSVGTCGFSAPPSAAPVNSTKNVPPHHKHHHKSPSTTKPPSLDIPAAAPSGGPVDNQTPAPVRDSATAPSNGGPVDSETPTPVSDFAPAPNAGPLDNETPTPVSANAAEAPFPPPSSGDDCSSLVYEMVSCLSFVGNNSTDSKPDVDCCNGLKTVVEANAECVCDSFSTAAQIGVSINLYKAAALPNACGVSLPPLVGTCGFSAQPSASPGKL